MKKLILTLASISTVTFAAPTIASAAFSNAQITCNGQVISSSDFIQTLSKQCKDFKAGKGNVVLYDENSHKTVECKTNGTNVETNTCQVKK